MRKLKYCNPVNMNKSIILLSVSILLMLLSAYSSGQVPGTDSLIHDVRPEVEGFRDVVMFTITCDAHLSVEQSESQAEYNSNIRLQVFNQVGQGVATNFVITKKSVTL